MEFGGDTLSLTPSREEGESEVLTEEAFRASYPELGGAFDHCKKRARVVIDARGYPERQVVSAVFEHGEHEYTVDVIKEISVAASALGYYGVRLIWQSESDADGLVWFQTQQSHQFREGCVVQLSEVIPELNGFHVVSGIAGQEGLSDGLTLFNVSHISESLSTVTKLTNGILWHSIEPSPPGLVCSQFEVDLTKAATVQLKRRPLTPPFDLPPGIPLFPGATADPPDASRQPSALESALDPEFEALLRPHSAAGAESVQFEGFRLPRAAIEQEKETEEIEFFRQITSDVSSDDEDEAWTVDETVPFPAEDYGMTELNCSSAVRENIVPSFVYVVDEKLTEMTPTLKFILFDDPDGLKFKKIFKEELGASVHEALMQRGDYACLVPQRLYGAVHRAMQKLEMTYQYYGGVLLHICDGLDRIYREQHFSLVRHRLEISPTNPFEHMLNNNQPAITYPLSVVDHGDALTPATMPHLASIVPQPEVSSLTDQQFKALFKNAPYLMKNEISKPKFLNKMKDYVGQRASGPLRKYQQICIDKFLSGGNYIFVAPTGAGKTKIFVECTRKLLETSPTATIVVLCPSVALVTQQACVFVVEGFLKDGHWVNCFSSDNQLPPQCWRNMVHSHNVMVLTPQLLLNAMDFYWNSTYSVFQEIDLLILDECHHVRKEHAYNKIMTAHKNTPNCVTQVIGFTASPTRSPDVEEGEQNLELLLDQMQAKCIVLTDANPEVQQHVPSAEEETAYADAREEDIIFPRSMGRMMYRACRRYLIPLVGKMRGIMKLPTQSLEDMGMGLVSSTFENWAKLTCEKLEENTDLPEWRKIDIISTIELLRACNNSLDLVSDAGFESSLKVLSQRILEIGGAYSADPFAPGRLFPCLIAGIYATRMIQSIAPVMQTYDMSPFPSGYSKFPRFIILVQFLDRFSSQGELHGIVFVKTRDGCFHLAKMLRMMPSLKNTLIFEFTGHGTNNKKKSQMPLASSSDALRGMSGSKQQEVLDRFCRPGRHILVSTSAAEEGINVTTCQFVVRYTVTHTGIQRVQSRGRSRVRGGIFFNIIQKDSKEAKFLERSQQEEENMNKVLQKSKRVEHI